MEATNFGIVRASLTEECTEKLILSHRCGLAEAMLAGNSPYFRGSNTLTLSPASELQSVNPTAFSTTQQGSLMDSVPLPRP